MPGQSPAEWRASHETRLPPHIWSAPGTGPRAGGALASILSLLLLFSLLLDLLD